MSEGKEMQLTGGFSLTPKSFEEAERFAKIMAESDMVPTAYKGKPGNILVAVQMGAELGIKPLQSLQGIAVINGKPSIYGDLGTAILRAGGCRIELDDIETIKKNNRARCIITRPGGEKIERTFGKDDAEKAGLWGKAGPWSTYTWRQMGWRAFWFAARDGAADMLKGMAGAEEAMDYPDAIETTTVPMPKRLDPAANGGTGSVPVDPYTPIDLSKVPKNHPAVALANTPNPEGQAPVEAVVHIADVKRLNKTGSPDLDHFEVIDSEGVVYATTEESIAKAAKDSKGTVRTILFQPVDGKAPVLMSVLPVAVKS